MNPILKGAFLVAALNFAATGTASAVPTLFFGEDAGFLTAVPAGGNAETARNDFLSNLDNVGNEDFEALQLGLTPPISLSFPGSSGNLTAVLNSAPSVFVTDQNTNSQFSTSGTQHLDAGFGNTLDIDFGATPIAAFGFYGTDISESGGDLVVELTDIIGNVSSFTIIENGDGTNGNVLFWGFVDSATTYSSVSLQNTANSDQFGFDDMVIGDQGQVTTQAFEPGTLVLGGLGLALAGFARVQRRT